MIKKKIVNDNLLKKISGGIYVIGRVSGNKNIFMIGLSRRKQRLARRR